MTRNEVANSFSKVLRTVYDFPIKGIQFIDIMPIIENPRYLQEIVDHLAHRYTSVVKCDAIATMEARGFLIASAISYKTGIPLIALRKTGKLPGEVATIEYQKEYGADHIEVHKNHPYLKAGKKIVLVDDLIATGGSAKAAIALLRQFDVQIQEASFLIELKDLKGVELLQKDNIASYSILTL